MTANYISRDRGKSRSGIEAERHGRLPRHVTAEPTRLLFASEPTNNLKEEAIGGNGSR